MRHKDHKGELFFSGFLARTSRQVKKHYEEGTLKSIVERYVSNVFYSERIVRVFYSQSDKILGVFYPK